MTDYKFIAFGRVNSSSITYARSDVEARAKAANLVLDSFELVREFALCDGSERPATTVTVASDASHPYRTGDCVRCGIAVPLLSADNFEVIRHFAPSNYKSQALE